MCFQFLNFYLFLATSFIILWF